MKSKKVIFIFGAPASGKDTQAKLLAKKLKGKMLVTSALFKELFAKKKRYVIFEKRKIDLNKVIEELKSGKLVNFYLAVYVVLKAIEKFQNKILIFSGSPRSVLEAKKEFNFLKKNKYLYKFFFLNVPYDVALKRSLKRQRKDIPLDSKEIFEKRWQEFEKYTLPARNFLKKRGVLVEIDGSQSVKAVHKEIVKNLSPELL